MDLGGTVLKAVAAKEDGVILSAKSLAINDRRGSIAQWVEGARRLISDFEGELNAKAPAIGVSAPGLASSDRRRIDYLPGKFFGIEGLDWTEALGRDTGVPVLNDAHAALLGECWVGVARQKRDVVMLTLGTGVGGAIMVDGRLFNGVIGRAGHLGHMSLDPDGSPSNTGMPGAIEVLIGDCTLQDRSSGRFSSTRDLVRAHRDGDGEAKAVWLRFAAWPEQIRRGLQTRRTIMASSGWTGQENGIGLPNGKKGGTVAFTFQGSPGGEICHELPSPT